MPRAQGANPRYKSAPSFHRGSADPSKIFLGGIRARERIILQPDTGPRRIDTSPAGASFKL